MLKTAILALGAAVLVAFAAMGPGPVARSTWDGRVEEILLRLRITCARTTDACAPGGAACDAAAAIARDTARHVRADLAAVHVPQDLRRAKRLVEASVDDLVDGVGEVGVQAAGPERVAAVSAMRERLRAAEDRAAALVGAGVALRR